MICYSTKRIFRFVRLFVWRLGKLQIAALSGELVTHPAALRTCISTAKQNNPGICPTAEISSQTVLVIILDPDGAYCT
jgi:hypothetical protein